MMAKAKQAKTYITEANLAPVPIVSVIVVWLAGQLGLEMSPEVAAAMGAFIGGVANVVLRAISKKGLI